MTLKSLSLFTILCAVCLLCACSDDNKNETANSDAVILKTLGVKTQTQVQPEAKEANVERLKMTIAEPDFDRSMTQPEINLEKSKGSSLDF